MLQDKLRILLVDDSKEDRFLLKQCLTESGLDCDIEEAWDGEQAELLLLKSMREGTLPNCVVLDMGLPRRSGLEVLTKLWEQGVTERTRVIVLSSVVANSEKAKLLQFGAWEVFEKPIELDAFLVLAKKLRDLCSACAVTPAD